MSSKSNKNGRAYEFAFLTVLRDGLISNQDINIEKNSSYYSSQNVWNALLDSDKENYVRGAKAGINLLKNLEPLIEDGDDILTLKMQSDKKGEEGDVRDLVIKRESSNWEIGLSLKHNHFAVKHNRISPTIDFSKKWFGLPCYKNYWDSVLPIFQKLDIYKESGIKWRELLNKKDDIYYPLLNAFINEIKTKYDQYGSIVPKKMVEYLLGYFDFYKVISIDNRKTTIIQSFNLRGNLNKASKKRKPELIAPIINLPTRIISIGFKPKSKNTVELYLDSGWQFNFRIHNASTIVESSLKFDVRLIGMPSSIIELESAWSK